MHHEHTFAFEPEKKGEFNLIDQIVNCVHVPRNNTKYKSRKKLTTMRKDLSDLVRKAASSGAEREL